MIIEPFDPLKSLWRPATTPEADIGTVNLRALPAFQRALLVTDGTVTKFIEIVTMEPTTVVLLEQTQHTLGREHPWLCADAQTVVISRQVLIEGKYSRTFYVHATSFLVPDRLPRDVCARLEMPRVGIGSLLRDLRMETRREVLWYGREHLTDLPANLRDRADGEFVSRTYRIFAGGVPIALIHEKFPILSGLSLLDGP